MQKKIYVVGMFDDDSASKVQAAVSGVSGVTNVVALPFIDSGSLNGEETNIKKFSTYNDFPQPGSSKFLYVDLSTNRIFHYEGNSGYTQLSNFTYTIQKTNVSNITYWRTGSATRLACEDGILKVTTGLVPSLNYETISVVRNVTKEAAE